MDLTKCKSIDLDFYTYDEAVCCFEAIRDERFDFKSSIIFNDGDERLIRSSSQKKGSRATTEWRLVQTFTERETAERSDPVGSGVKPCLCIDFRGVFFDHVLKNVCLLLQVPSSILTQFIFFSNFRYVVLY